LFVAEEEEKEEKEILGLWVRLKKCIFEQRGGGGFVILFCLIVFCFVLSLSGCVFLVSGT
jgi:hypothetical protein